MFLFELAGQDGVISNSLPPHRKIDSTPTRNVKTKLKICKIFADFRPEFENRTTISDLYIFCKPIAH